MERGLTRQQVFSELAKSPHGKLEEYVPVGAQVASEDPEFLAHLTAWNFRNGQIRDSKAALPVLAIDALVKELVKNNGRSLEETQWAYMSNSQALLALLPPRELLKSVKFAKSANLSGRRRTLWRLVSLYLWNLEANWKRWEAVAVRHRKTLKELYAYCSVKPTNAMVGRILFDGFRPPGSVFEVVANLSNMSPLEAAANIVSRKIPFLVAAGALGAKMREKEILMALVERMSPAELMNNMKKLEEFGVRKSPELRATLEKALTRAGDDRSASTLKISKTLDVVEDEELRDKIKVVQEKKLDKSSVEGDWLVLADCSGSMRVAMDVATVVAETLARSAKGSVHLVFFDTHPRYFNATGKTLEEIKKMTAGVTAGGSTSIGCGLNYALVNKIEVDGVAIVSDGGENAAPEYHTVHAAYCKKFEKDVPTYLYHVEGDQDRLSPKMAAAGTEMQKFPLTGVDYYSIPGMVATMRTNRYSLMDEVMDTPLLNLGNVLKLTSKKEEMHA